MDYNTERETLKMSEYGRGIQQMVEHCKHIANRNERMRCACTIINAMAAMTERTTTPEDYVKKLWNHLAAIADYQLDIDYPVEITRHDMEEKAAQHLPYPQSPIRKRNYGKIVEKFANYVSEMPDNRDRYELAHLVANHMKRDLCNWSVDTMSDDKVADDLMAYTRGAVQLNLRANPLISDGELLSTRISTSVKKKKKK